MSVSLKEMQAATLADLDAAEDAAELEANGGMQDSSVEDQTSDEQVFDLGADRPLDGEDVDNVLVNDDHQPAGAAEAVDAEKLDNSDRDLSVTQDIKPDKPEVLHDGNVASLNKRKSYAAMRRKKREDAEALEAKDRVIAEKDKALAESEAKNARLERSLEVGGVEAIPADVTPQMLNDLRESHGDEVANVIEALAAKAGVNIHGSTEANASDREVAGVGVAADNSAVSGSNADAPRDDRQGQGAFDSFGAMLDAAGDDEPIQELGMWAEGNDADSQAKFAQAMAVQDTLNKDPNFQGMHQIDFYNEVVKRVTTQPSFDKPAGTQAAAVPQGAGAGSDVPARPAVPNSLSDAPGDGGFTGGSVIDQVSAMSTNQMIEWRKTATKAQLEALDDALFG